MRKLLGYQFFAGGAELMNTENPSRKMLELSLKYQVSNVGHTFLVSTPKLDFKIEGLTILDMNDIISSETLEKLGSLDRWNEKELIESNHYPVERLCFLRWMVLLDLANKLRLKESDCICISDWDNFIFSKPEIDQLVNKLPVSYHNDPHTNPFEIHPAFSLFSVDVLRLYNQNILNLRIYERLRSKDLQRFYNDKLIWALIQYRLFSKGGQNCGDINKLFTNTIACRNIRHLKDSDYVFAEDSINLPKHVNYSSESIFKYAHAEIEKCDGVKQVNGKLSNGNMFHWANLDFQGVEGKYLFHQKFYNDLR